MYTVIAHTPDGIDIWSEHQKREDAVTAAEECRESEFAHDAEIVTLPRSEIWEIIFRQ